jgi:hypothetical protein
MLPKPTNGDPYLTRLVGTLNAEIGRREPTIVGRSFDGTTLAVRFRAALDTPWVQVHVQSTAAGKGGIAAYDSANYVSTTLVDCRADRLQDITVTVTAGVNYLVFLVPVQYDGAGTKVLYDGQSGRPDCMAKVGANSRLWGVFYDKGGVVYNAMHPDFAGGVKFDGVTDDRVAAQACLDFCHAAGGGIVQLPAGTGFFTLATNPHIATVATLLRSYSNITVRGCGPNATKITWGANLTPPAGFSAPGQFHMLSMDQPYTANPTYAQHDVAFEDFTLDGNAANQSSLTNLHFGLFIGATRGAWVTRVRVKNLYGLTPGPPTETFHFEFNTSVDGHFTNCEAFSDDGGDTATGFSSDASTGVEWKGCVAGGMQHGQGFTAWTGALLRYTNCHAYLCGQNGFNAELCDGVTYTACIGGGQSADYGSSAFFTALLALGNLNGFRAMGSKNVVWSGCVATYNTGAGFQTVDYAGPVHCDTILMASCISRYNLNGVDLGAGTLNAQIDASSRIDSNTGTDIIHSATDLSNNIVTRSAQAPYELFVALNGSSGVRYNVRGTAGQAYRFLIEDVQVGAFDRTGDLDFIGGFREVVDSWDQDLVVAGQTAVELTRAAGRWRAPRAGSVTGVVVASTAARVAGTLTINVYKNTGLADAAGALLGTLAAVLDGTNTSRKATTQAKDTDVFAAGDELYLVVTTDAGWLPVTANIRAALEVET